MHVPSPELPYLLLASVSAGKSDHYDFTELSTEYIYALDLCSLGRDPVTSFVTCLERLPRVASNRDVSCRLPYVCSPAFLAFVGSSTFCKIRTGSRSCTFQWRNRFHYMRPFGS